MSAATTDPNRTVVIGGAAGMWGDTSLSTPQLLASGRCDYIMYEGLAEITMGILTRARMANPERGYATDIIRTIAANLAAYAEQGIKVVTNAGGINPTAAADVIRAAAAEAGLDMTVASVVGDDLAPRLDELREVGLTEMTDGGPLPEWPVSVNAYLGARPIAAALDAGADVVVTGRCVDSALALGPLMHEFGWTHADLDRLSQGSLAGHLLECGPQSTGGLFTDWDVVDSWHTIGYPIAECRADGSFVLTKADGTSGLVSVATAAEQLLYEIGDPAAYLLPDVTCDWTRVHLEQVGTDRVEVTGARGRPAPPTLKAGAQVLDGFKMVFPLSITGRGAVERARRLGVDAIARAQHVLEAGGMAPLADVQVDVLGAEDTYGAHARRSDSREVILRIAVAHEDERALKAIMRELPSFGLAVVGISGGSGLPKPTPRVRLRSYAVPRELLPATVDLGDDAPFEVADDPALATAAPVDRAPTDATATFDVGPDPVVLPLVAVAHARSGDKGGDANIGVRARHPDFLPLVRAQVTAATVADHLAHVVDGAVERHDLPGIDAVNLHLHDALGGGGIASLRNDPQGKAFAQQLLDMEVTVPRAWLDHAALADIPEVAAARA